MLTHPSVIDRDSALAFLQGRVNYERASQIPYRASEFKLDRMRRLLERLGNPHYSFPALHIAGTKGKGSTATMAASVLTASGYRTGLYTSPHLTRLEERFVIDGQICRDGEFVRLAAEVAEAVAELDGDPRPESGGATFFEITTAMAFLHFARQRVDLAVLEVGLGGRLDSTNVCRPLACAITSISLDHTKQLGSTLAEIAAEKAGIAKRDVPLVSGVTSQEPQIVIQRTAAAAGAPLMQRGVHFDYEMKAGQRLDYWDQFDGSRFELRKLELSMLGEHQASNAAVAIALLRQLDPGSWKVPEHAIHAGLREARCPARVEIVSRKPLVIMDAAHNAASIAALLQAIDELAAPPRGLLIFGTTRDKDLNGMLPLLTRRFDHILFTRYINNPRAVDPSELAALARSLELPADSHPKIEVCETPQEAWERACQLQPDYGFTCITGSFFLAAELKPLMSNLYDR